MSSRAYRLRFFALLVLLLVSGALISARWKASEVVIPAASSQDQRNVTQLEAELVTVTPTGFEPAEITRPRGPFVLAIDNRSGLEEVDFYLEREAGTRLDVSLSRKRKLAWREKLDLAAGRYVLRAVNDDSWRCLITLAQ